MDEGYIKYRYNHMNSGPPPKEKITDLNKWRLQFYQPGPIGSYYRRKKPCGTLEMAKELRS